MKLRFQIFQNRKSIFMGNLLFNNSESNKDGKKQEIKQLHENVIIMETFDEFDTKTLIYDQFLIEKLDESTVQIIVPKKYEIEKAAHGYYISSRNNNSRKWLFKCIENSFSRLIPVNTDYHESLIDLCINYHKDRLENEKDRYVIYVENPNYKDYIAYLTDSKTNADNFISEYSEFILHNCYMIDLQSETLTSKQSKTLNQYLKTLNSSTS